MTSTITLTLTEDNGTTQDYIFDSPTTCLVGRADDCYINFPDDKTHRTISRYHCQFNINPPQITIRDLGSYHGTFLNRQKIGQRPSKTPFNGKKVSFPEYPLKSGDQVTVESVTFTVNIKQNINKSSDTVPIQSYPETPHPVNTKIQNLLTFVQQIFQRKAKEESPFFLTGYTINQKIGEGGFGEVYLASHHKTNQKVAIKIMLPDQQNDTRQREQFMRELENNKVLKHPNIVQLQDYGYSDGIFFFSLEYCDGGTLEQLLENRGKPLEIEEAVNITLQLLDALDYAHHKTIPYVKLKNANFTQGKGLVHRDITPQNILLNNQGQPLQAKLADFGLAKSFQNAGLTDLTISGQHLEGKLPFMSREQVLNFKYAQPDVDVWSVAACLYYMLTLNSPRNFRGHADPLLVVLQTQPDPIHRYNSSIPDPLANLIDSALEESREIHFKTAKTFKMALESLGFGRR